MKRGLIFILVFLLSISYISAAVTFPANNVSIKVGNTDRTLQYASDNGLLKGTQTYASASISTIIGQHDASQIWVKTNSGEKTLLSALSSGANGLCGSGSSLIYSSSPDKSQPYHFATEVILSSGINLQTAINAGTFCGCVPGTTKSCGTNTACATYTDVTCTASGTWPTCTPTYVAFGSGTNCNGDNWHACDGAGSCLGYRGSGCGGCLLGTSGRGCSGSYIGDCTCNVPSGWVAKGTKYICSSSPPSGSYDTNSANCKYTSCEFDGWWGCGSNNQCWAYYP
jgi:hypothetical protein